MPRLIDEVTDLMRSLFLCILSFFALFGGYAAEALEPVGLKILTWQNASIMEGVDTSWVDRGGIELITGGPSSKNTQSFWGHTSLRLVGSGRSPLEDMVIEGLGFGEPTVRPVATIYEGLTGGTPMAIQLKTMSSQIRFYYFSEFRGYKRAIIPSTSDQRQRLLKLVKEINNQPFDDYRPYYFLSNNCTSFILRLLLEAGFPQLSSGYFMRPSRAPFHLRKSLVTPWPEIDAVSLEELNELESVALSSPDFGMMTTLDLQRLIVFSGLILSDFTGVIVKELSKRSDKKSTETVYGLEAFPDFMYQLGAPISVQEVQRVFPKASLKAVNRFNRAAWFTGPNGEKKNLCDQKPEQCSYFKKGMEALL